MSHNSNAHSIIAAQPGWYVAMFVPRFAGSDGWDAYLNLMPIVAWDIEREELTAHTEDNLEEPQHFYHRVMPLTVDGNMNRWAKWWAIKTPDGRFSTPDGMCDNEADAMDVLKQMHDEDLKERAAAAAQRTPAVQP
jgi:hypothetical protein